MVVADPNREVLRLHAARGVQTLGGSDTFSHEALPGFAFRVAAAFAEIKPR